ncbi:hypothetical protein [uncultured Pyramidobacter sp.]|nr:hypothetical protein [uncultured Pyramidobacter sp.]
MEKRRTAGWRRSEEKSESAAERTGQAGLPATLSGKAERRAARFRP